MFEFTTVRGLTPSMLMLAVCPIADMGERANINYYRDCFMLSNESANQDVTAVLLIQSYRFQSFICDQEIGCCGINPRILHQVLDPFFNDECSLVAIGDDHQKNMRLHFADEALGRYTMADPINLLDQAPYLRLEFDDLDYALKGVIAINSVRFRNNLMLLRGYGLLVNVYITHNQLRLSTGTKMIVLRKEMGECIIVRVAENDQPIEFSFSLEHLTAYHNASILTPKVWILTPRDAEKAFMLICPAWSLGKIVFQFHQSSRNLKRKRSPRFEVQTPAKKSFELQLNEGRKFSLKEIVAPIRNMKARAIVNYCPDGASLKRSDPNSKLTVAFQFSSSSFRCDVDSYAAINTRDLDFCLEDVSEDGKIRIISDRANDRILDFVFEDTTGSTFCYSTSMTWHEVYDDHSLIIVDLQYKFKSDVGILSLEFRRILMDHSFFGKLVHVSIKNNQLEVSAVNEKIDLKWRMGNALLAVLQKMTQFDFHSVEHKWLCF